ncbi:MAG: hypothetical protein GJT30_17535 [Geobacter sp.]|nr:hypothetical protein [Geobacter sp.]
MRHDLDWLKTTLIRRGIPVRQACRLVGELADHVEDAENDLLLAGKSPREAALLAREKLGGMELLADEISTCFAKRTFWGKHPVLSFVLLPLFSFALIPIVPIVTGNLLVRFLDRLKEQGIGYDLQAVLSYCNNGFLAYQYLLAAVCAAGFIGIATRYACSMKWAAAATGILAVLGGLLVSVLTVGPPVHAGAHLSGTITLGFELSDMFSPERIVRFSLPLAMFALLAGKNVWHGYIKPTMTRG